MIHVHHVLRLLAAGAILGSTGLLAGCSGGPDAAGPAAESSTTREKEDDVPAPDQPVAPSSGQQPGAAPMAPQGGTAAPGGYADEPRGSK